MNKKFIKSLIFNIIETILIILIGISLNMPINSIICIMLVFMISRGFFGKSLHFKKWYRCLIYSCTIMLSLFCVLKIDFKLCVLFAIFSGFIMTGRANITEIYLWKPANESKYKDIEEFIKYHKFNDDVLTFEKNLRKVDDVLFLVYKYRFIDKLTFKEISEKLDMENPRIVEKLNQIALAIRINFQI